MADWQLADVFARIGAIQFGQFTLRSGKVSPYYCNLSILAGYPKWRRYASDMLWRIAKENFDFDMMADVPSGSTQLVTLMSDKYNIPMITPRRPKELGHSAKVEGVFQSGQKVIVFEDVVTTGGSILAAIQILVDHGLSVIGACDLIDRQQGGRENLAKAGYKLHSVYNILEMINHYIERTPPLITVEQYDAIIKYIHDPAS